MSNIDLVRLGLKQLTFYRGILSDQGVGLYVHLLDCLAQEDIESEEVLGFYAKLTAFLIEETELSSAWQVGDPWQDYLLEKIVENENVFSSKAERLPFSEIGKSLLEVVTNDFLSLQKAFFFNLTSLARCIEDRLTKKHRSTFLKIDWENYYTSAQAKDFSYYDQKKTAIKKLLADSLNWDDCLESMADYYREAGMGLLAKYWAFNWDRGLHGISHLDPIRLQSLIGYEQQKEKVMKNTEQFLAGLGANNLLLYGDRGTGKSSIIKALVHEYGHLGLRILEVTKQQLQEIPKIIRQLRVYSQRFIIFMDDLSFEEQETEYKYLKAVLEGGLEFQPENVRIYATSNRRHLIRESFADRKNSSEDLHIQDTIQEKLSLADRFGVSITFTAPSRNEYLSIVEGLAWQKGINLPLEELNRMALQWELQHNGRSGRTAKQFIEDLSGKLPRQ